MSPLSFRGVRSVEVLRLRIGCINLTDCDALRMEIQVEFCRIQIEILVERSEVLD